VSLDERRWVPASAGTTLKSCGICERTVLALTDAMTRDVQVPHALFEAIAQYFDLRAVTELVATIAAYNMVSRFLEALRRALAVLIGFGPGK